MKYQVLFSLKNNEKVFINVVCSSRDWRFKGKIDNVFGGLQNFIDGDSGCNKVGPKCPVIDEHRRVYAC